MREYIGNLETEHLRELVAWAKVKSTQNNTLFLVESLAPTILGVKPSELLNVAMDNERYWEDFKEIFTKQNVLRIEEVRDLNGRLQVIFYHKKILDSVLTDQPIKDFLTTLSYPRKYSLEAYLGVLKQRIIAMKFPHEVGIFLGYPLKDVLGFMEILPLPYRRTQGWRIYGDVKPSNEVYEKYSQARCLMRKLAGELE